MSQTKGPATWMADEVLPKLPKRRRWKISIEPNAEDPENQFDLLIAIQCRILFWWTQDDYLDTYRYQNLIMRIAYRIDATLDLEEIHRHAKYLKDLKYPDVAEIPTEFQTLTGTYKP